MSTIRLRWSSLVAALCTVCVVVPLQAQERSTITGLVRDQQTGRPISGAQVVIVGSRISVETARDGRYVIRNVAPGQQPVRVNAFGYGSQSRTVSVAAASSVTADFALALSALELEELVVTATGEQKKRELGHTISSLDVAAKTETAPIANMNDLLVARTPGVTVTPGNITGAEARIRIRGMNSLSLGNDPVFVIDGIRMENASGSSSIGIGGTEPSRVNDLNPEEIESIDFVKGPSASALYGTAAANGVIVIKTKRGRAGATQWTAYAEGGAIRDNNNWPIAYRGWRTGTTSTTNSTRTNNVQCILTQVAAGVCAQDSVSTFNLFDDVDSPNGTGNRQQYGLQVSGGTDALRFFLSGEWEDELGVLRMPGFARDILKTKRQISEIPNDQLHPNGRNRVSVRANLGVNPMPTLNIDVSTGYTTSKQRFPQTDNNTTGLLSNAFGGPGHKDNAVIEGGVERPLYGYRLYTPDMFFSETVEQHINRFIGSATATWTPRNWFTGRLTGGIDYTNRVDTDLCRRGECTPFSQTTITGFKEDNRTNFFDYTLDGSGSAEYPLAEAWSGRTSVGLQYTKRQFNRNGAFSEDLPPGSTTLTSGAIPDVDETTTVSATLGTYLDQQLGWRDRVFVNAGLRVDDNSAFGEEFSAVFYPKAGVSWVISEESFFPAARVFNELRLRGAWGASGVQPGTTDAIAFFSPVTAAIENQDRAAIVFAALGNKDLKPERSTEYEVGFDAGVLRNRVGLEFTYYHKKTKDALIARTVAPSVGAATTRFENIGSIQNKGWEASIHAQVVDKSLLALDVTVGASHNQNEIVDLGGTPPVIGTTISEKEGFPLHSYWLRPYTFSDADGNGIISASEITVGDTAVFIGQNLPVNEITVTTGIGLFERKLHLNAGFDYKGGHYQLNGTERIRCESRLNCDGLVDPAAPLWKQARVVALRETAARTQFGFVEDASFFRLRELSATYDLPSGITRYMRARRVSLTAAARNLKVWTDYTGLDPEAGYFAGGDIQTDFQTHPPPTYYTFRVNLNF